LFGAFYIIAKVFSFLIAVCNSYFFNRRWTFRSQNKERFSEFSRFLVVSTIGMGLNTLIMFIAVDRLKLFDIYGLIIATATVVFWNFSANKLYTFRESKK
jgi:putative flippase GtrA